MRKLLTGLTLGLGLLLGALGLGGRPGGDPVLPGQPPSDLRRQLPAVLGGLTARERQAAAAGVEIRLLRVDGRLRRYHFHVPPGIDPDMPPALVVGLHGGGGNGLAFAQGVDLRRMAARMGAVLVVPQAWGRFGFRRGSWNADSRVRLGFAERQEVDDVRFLMAVIESMEIEAGTDPARVYVTGVSKGGMMAYRLACARPDRIAAIAVVAGTLSTDRCPDGAAVPLLHIHGTDDGNVPMEGGAGPYSARGADWPPVMPGIDLFRRANGCAEVPEEVRAASDTTCRIWRGPEGREVRLCLVEGGGHAWPGARPTRPQLRRGVYVSAEFDATAAIADFFGAQARRQGPG
jgi:polyhydroxybutyrate depolymerase